MVVIMKNQQSLTKISFILLLSSAVIPSGVQAGFSIVDIENFAKAVLGAAVGVGTVGSVIIATAFEYKQEGGKIGVGVAEAGVGAVIVAAGIGAAGREAREARIGAGTVGAGVGVMLVGSMLALAEEKEIKIGEVTGVVVRAVLGAGTVIGAAIGSILIS